MTRAIVAILVLVGVASAASRASAENECAACHATLRDSRLRVADGLAESVHVDLTCIDCHGGRADEPTVDAHDAAAGFRSRLVAGSLPGLCGDCHADADRFAADAGTPLPDQLEHYEASFHGKALAAGNDLVATCVTCHGSHRVFAVDDPRSRVHPARIVETCAHCHSDADRMGKFSQPHDQERQWRRSAHGRAFVEWLETSVSGDEERHPPACNDCHNPHELESAEEAAAACVPCHEEEDRSFRDSAHADAFERLGFLPCVECHGSHEVPEAHAGLIGIQHDTACRRCHSEDEDEVAAAVRQMSEDENHAESEADRARRSLGVLEGDPRLRELEEAERDLRLAVHSLDQERVSEAASELLAAVDRLAVPDESGPQRSWAWGWALGVVPVVLLAGGLVLLLRRRRRARGAS